ncbi:MAG: alpha/beta fold hydrolase, partial [bacterium]
FATGPTIWRDQIHELAKDFHVTTDLDHIEKAEDVVIVGWSMGGWKAIELCLEHHKKIKGLILVSAFPKYVQSDDYPYGQPLALLKKLEKRFLTDYRSGMEYFYDLVFQDKVNHKLIDHLTVPEEAELQRWFEKLEHEDLRPLLPKIIVPVLVIQGDKDPIVNPATAEYLNSELPNSELRTLDGVGHAPFLESKEEFNKMVRDFVRKV